MLLRLSWCAFLILVNVYCCDRLHLGEFVLCEYTAFFPITPVLHPSIPISVSLFQTFFPLLEWLADNTNLLQNIWCCSFFYFLSYFLYFLLLSNVLRFRVFELLIACHPDNGLDIFYENFWNTGIPFFKSRRSHPPNIGWLKDIGNEQDIYIKNIMSDSGFCCCGLWWSVVIVNNINKFKMKSLKD